jgi:hypothetical protein
MGSKRLTTKFTAGALSVTLGVAALTWSAPVRAEEDVPLDTRIFRGILEGMGLRKDGEPINYQERAPLVIPPGRALPVPEKSDAVVAKNPAWPKDPDVIRRKQEAVRDRNRNVEEERRREENPLRPDQMTPGGTPRVARRADPDGVKATPDGPDNQLMPSELGTKGNLFSNMFGKKDDGEVVKFTGEPPRASLTEPPPGYRTPSPDQPYGILSKEKATPENYKESHGKIEGDK